MLSISKVFTNVASGAGNGLRAMAPGIIRFVPSVFAATICLGLREQIPLVSREALNDTSSRILEISTALFGYIALKSIWNSPKEEPLDLSTKTVVKNDVKDVVDEKISEISGDELVFLRQEVSRLKKEIADNEEKFNMKLFTLRTELANELDPFVDMGTSATH
jgi:hypothetical protein